MGGEWEGGIQARFLGRWAPCGHRLIHLTSSCQRKLDLRTAAQHIRSSVQRFQLRRQILSLFLKIFHARLGSSGPTWWRTRTASLAGSTAHGCTKAPTHA